MNPQSPNRPLAVAFGGLIALAAALGISRFVYTPILPAMAEALNLSKSQAGLIASANFLGYLAGAMLAATPVLPGARRHWLIGALTLSALTTIAMGLVSTMPGFLLLRGVGGGASAFVMVMASVTVMESLVASSHSHLEPVHFAGVGIGIVISALVVAALLPSGANWRILWLATGAATAAAVPVVAWLMPPASAAAPRTAAAGRPRPPGLTGLAAAYGLFGFGYVVTATFLVAIVRAAPGLHSAEPLVWLVVGITAVPSVGIWARVASRLSIPRAFALACLIEAAGVAFSVLWSSVTGVLVAAALLGGTFMGLTALGLAGARRAAPHNPRPTLAVMTAVFGVGQIIGPSLAGTLADRTGGYLAPSLLAAAALMASAAIVLRTQANAPL